MIARVVPALKLPAQFNYFDYQIPPGLAVQPGDFVRVPFRGQTILGIVFEVRDRPESTRFSLKSVLDVLPVLRLPPALLDVLRETALKIKSNLPFLVHALTPELPVKWNTRQKNNFFPLPRRGKIKMGVAIQAYDTPDAHLSLLRTALRTAKGQILIITPEIADVQWLSKALQKSKRLIVTLTSDLSKTKAWDAYAAFASGQADVLIGTRLAALVPAPRLTRLILDRDEDLSLVQSDMHPHYDARDIFDLRARLERIPLTIFSETPRVGRGFLPLVKGEGEPACRQAGVGDIVSLRDHWRSRQPGFITEKLHDAIAGALGEKNQTILFFNRKGYVNLVVCKDCQEVIPAPGDARDAIPLFCPKCQSPELKMQKPGIEKFAQDVQRSFPHATVATLSRAREGQAALPYPEADIIICTEVFLHWYRTRAYESPLGCVAAVFADPLWHKPDFRANEQALVTLRSFQNLAMASDAPFIVQTADPDARVIRALAGDLKSFYTEELADRKALGYPPFPPPTK